MLKLGTKWTGHDGSDCCPVTLRGTTHKVQTVWYDPSGNTGVETLPCASHRNYWGNVAAWRVVEPTLDERLLKYLKFLPNWSLARDELIEELKERIAKDD